MALIGIAELMEADPSLMGRMYVDYRAYHARKGTDDDSLMSMRVWAEHLGLDDTRQSENTAVSIKSFDSLSIAYHLYHLVDDKGVVIYVGMTTNPASRLASHKRDKDGVDDMMIVGSFDNLSDCALAETLEIYRLMPKYNVLEQDRAVRQAEGIAKAKASGKYKGRKPALTKEQVGHAREQVANGKPKAKVARDLGVSRQTLYNALDGDGTYGSQKS